MFKDDDVRYASLNLNNNNNNQKCSPMIMALHVHPVYSTAYPDVKIIKHENKIKIDASKDC